MIDTVTKSGVLVDRADIIIIGAGPAGCAAAIRARQAGLRVLIFEATASPRMAPGETLHPGVEPLLTQLGVREKLINAGFRRHRGVWLERGSERSFLSYGEAVDGPWLGFQAERQTLHRILQQAAVDRGVTLLRNARPETLLVDGCRVIGVEAAYNRYHAPWTVDATGRCAWLARNLRLPVKIRSPRLGIRFGWNKEEPAYLNGQPSFAFRHDGWNWQAPLGGNQTAWVELRIKDSERAVTAGTDHSWQVRPHCAGPGYFLLGDAAASLDPSSSHGVLRALMSGIFFGHLIENCRRTGIREEYIAEAYRTWLCTQFEQDETRLRQLYIDLPAGQRFVCI